MKGGLGKLRERPRGDCQTAGLRGHGPTVQGQLTRIKVNRIT